jgi:glycosyltransferase involved in cell wall biosynthesis
MTRESLPSLSVVVATYEWPAALDAVLWALSEQSDSDFDVVVADDGSGPGTATVVDRWLPAFDGGLRHVRQDDDGFRLARVKNLGALAATGDFIVMIDGDAVPRRGFVAAMRKSAVAGWFVAGKRLELDQGLSHCVLSERLPVHRWSLPRWLRERSHAEPLAALTPRDRRRPGRPGLPEFVPHTEGYGFLLGLFREDFNRVNGFDTRYEQWGEEDVDLAVRLHRLGLRCGWPGPHGTLLHLWHEERKGTRPNVGLVEETRASERVEAVRGLREMGEEDPPDPAT